MISLKSIPIHRGLRQVQVAHNNRVESDAQKQRAAHAGRYALGEKLVSP